MRFAKEIWPFLTGSVVLTLGVVLAAQAMGFTPAVPILALVGGLVTALVIYFFRDPERPLEAGPGQIVSGADGVVRAVEVMDEPLFLKQQAVRISVFLSVFNVHVNRTPVGGRVEKVEYNPGKHLFAYLDAASEVNEHSSVHLQGGDVDCLVRQIVGPVARRVVCWKQAGDTMEKGQRLGIMKFGSRLDVYLPFNKVDVVVAKGDKVTAGQTVIAILKRESVS